MKKLNIKLPFKFSKKILIVCAVLLVVLVGSIIGLVVCNKSTKQAKVDLNSHFIEIRDTMFITTSEDYVVSLLSGQRETDYAIDGEVTELVPFGVLMFNRLDGGIISSSNITYAVSFNESYFTGNMQASSYDNSYLVDIEQEIPTDTEVKVTINLGNGEVIDSTMQCVSNDFAVTKAEAIELASENLKSNIQAMEKNGNWEAYIRILKDYSDSENQTYFWYIACIANDGSTAGILIDSSSKEIVSIKC